MDTTDIWQHQQQQSRSSFYLDDGASSPRSPHEPLFSDDYLASSLSESSLPHQHAPSFSSWAEQIASRLSWNPNFDLDVNDLEDEDDVLYSDDDNDDDFYQTKLALQVCLFSVGKARVVDISREGSLRERPLSLAHYRQSSVSSHSSAVSQQSSGGFSTPSDSSSISGWTKTPAPTSPHQSKPISPSQSIHKPSMDQPIRPRTSHRRNLSGSVSKSYKAKLDKDATPIDMNSDETMSSQLKRTSLVLPSMPIESPKSPRAFRNRTWFRS